MQSLSPAPRHSSFPKSVAIPPSLGEWPHVAELLLGWKELLVCCSLTWVDARARTHIPACRNTTALTNLIEIPCRHPEALRGVTDSLGRGVS